MAQLKDVVMTVSCLHTLASYNSLNNTFITYNQEAQNWSQLYWKDVHLSKMLEVACMDVRQSFLV